MDETTPDEQSLAEYLNEIGATSDVVQQGLRYYLAERSGDLPPTHMEERLVSAAEDARAVEEQLQTLQASSSQLEELSLLYLSYAWDNPAERSAIRRALQGANLQLPVVESAVVAIVVMYGMYLIATRGRSGVRETTRRDADGSFRTVKETTYASPAGWISGIINLFTPSP